MCIMKSFFMTVFFFLYIFYSLTTVLFFFSVGMNIGMNSALVWSRVLVCDGLMVCHGLPWPMSTWFCLFCLIKEMTTLSVVVVSLCRYVVTSLEPSWHE